MTVPAVPPSAPDLARPLLVAVALGIVYVVWGSTYLGIKIMVEQMPPLQSAGARYLAGGLLLAALLAAFSGLRRLAVTRAELAGCALLGLLLPALGNGLVTVGEDLGAPSGITALLIAGVPLWVVLYRLAARDDPGALTVVGVLVGLGGLAGLVGLTGFAGDLPLGALLLIVFATLCWSFGSWYQPRLTLPRDPFVVAVYEMVVGGAIMLAAGLARGETWEWDAISARSWVAWVYLVVVGSVVAFSAYVWVLQAAPISLVATYAYVNPVVAVFLGWLVLAEPVTPVVVASGAVVLGAVALVVGAERRTPAPPREPEAALPARRTD
ncbi:MAG: EamA family transporter [Actinomycetota bacterium]|nr:EamA family transporter [Actinomycetota bacterium]